MTLPALEEQLVEATRTLQDARTNMMNADLAVFDAERDLKTDEAIARVEGVEGKNADEAAAQKRRIAELEAALRPFSAIVIEPGSIQEVYLRTEDILAARAALQEKDSPEEEDAI